MRAAAQAHVGDIEAVGVGGLERIHDVFGARIAELAGEDVVVAQQGTRRDAGHVVGDDAVHRGGRAEVARHGAGDVGAVLLHRLGGESLLRRAVAEHLGDDHLVVRQGVGADLVLRGVAGVAEAGMGDVDAGVDDGNLDTVAGAGHAAALGPRLGRADQCHVGVGRVRVVQRLVLRGLDHRCRRHLRQRRAVELHRHRVQRDVEFTGDFGTRHVRTQPGFVVVAQRRKLGPVGLGRGVAEIDLLARCRLGLDVGRERVAVELHQRGAGVLCRTLGRIAVAVLARGGQRRHHRQRKRTGQCKRRGKRSQEKLVHLRIL